MKILTTRAVAQGNAMEKDTLNLTISVNKKHIANSQPDDCWKCPISLAVYDAWPTVDLFTDDNLFKEFDIDFPFSVSTYLDGTIVLWTEDVHSDLVLAIGRFDPSTVPPHPTRPLVFDVQFVIVEDEDLETL